MGDTHPRFVSLLFTYFSFTITMYPRRILPVLLGLAATVGLWAQPSPPRLIVRGDDLGSAAAANEAMIRCYREGVQRSVEVMVPTPWFPQAVRLLRENPGLDVGVHLTLTSEWDAVKWRPLTPARSFVDDDGYFLPMIWPNPNYPGRAIRERSWDIHEIEREFRAQIETAMRHIPQVSHLSGHMGCTDLDPAVSEMTRRLAREYGLLFDVKDTSVVKLGYAGPKASSEEKIASFLQTLEGLEAGKTYLFVDHPGLDTPEMRAFGHVGYAGVAVDRQGVTDAWTHPRVLETVRRLGIQLISYADLRGAPAAKPPAPQP